MTRPNIFRVVLGPCAQFNPSEALEQNGPNHQNLNQKRQSFDFDTILFVSKKKKKTLIKIWTFLWFSGPQITILSPIDFSFALPVNLNVSARKIKFEVDILKNVAKIGQL